jgi:hypothetical protein
VKRRRRKRQKALASAWGEIGARLDATWGVHLLKDGSLFMTGYRTGNKGTCGHDATGWKLYARSATRCADRGDGFLAILRIYYGPVAVVTGGGNGSSAGSTFQTINFSAPKSTHANATTTDPGTTTADTSIATTTAPDTGVVTAEAGPTGGVGTVISNVDVPSPAVAPGPASGPEPASDYVPIGGLAFTAG